MTLTFNVCNALMPMPKETWHKYTQAHVRVCNLTEEVRLERKAWDHNKHIQHRCYRLTNIQTHHGFIIERKILHLPHSIAGRCHFKKCNPCLPSELGCLQCDNIQDLSILREQAIERPLQFCKENRTLSSLKLHTKLRISLEKQDAKTLTEQKFINATTYTLLFPQVSRSKTHPS